MGLGVLRSPGPPLATPMKVPLLHFVSVRFLQHRHQTKHTMIVGPPPNRHTADPPRRRRRRWLGCMRWVSERVDDTVTDRPGRCICQSVSRRSVYERWTVIGSNVRAGSAAPRGLSARYSATRVCIVMLQQLITKNSTMQHYGWVRHRCFLLSRLSDPYTLQLN